MKAGLRYSRGLPGRLFTPVLMFRAGSATQCGDERMEFLIRDRLDRLRFLGLEPVTKRRLMRRVFRERLTKAIFQRRALSRARYFPRGDQIVAWSPRRSNVCVRRKSTPGSVGVKPKISGGWMQPGQAARKDVDARWPVKFR